MKPNIHDVFSGMAISIRHSQPGFYPEVVLGYFEQWLIVLPFNVPCIVPISWPHLFAVGNFKNRYGEFFWNMFLQPDMWSWCFCSNRRSDAVEMDEMMAAMVLTSLSCSPIVQSPPCSDLIPSKYPWRWLVSICWFCGGLYSCSFVDSTRQGHSWTMVNHFLISLHLKDSYRAVLQFWEGVHRCPPAPPGARIRHALLPLCTFGHSWSW